MGLHGVVARLSRGISMGSLPILVAKVILVEIQCYGRVFYYTLSCG